jgi:hypothetical protein
MNGYLLQTMWNSPDFITQADWATGFQKLEGQSFMSWWIKHADPFLINAFADVDVLFYQAGAGAHISDQSSESTSSTKDMRIRDCRIWLRPWPGYSRCLESCRWTQDGPRDHPSYPPAYFY